jgi:uncharacterized protein (DUF58 family)
MTEPAAHRPAEREQLLAPEFVRRLEQLDINVRRIFRGRTKGERRSRRRGESVEFADYKNYVVGDDLRHIDWNIFARLERLFIKLFLEQEDLYVYVLFDTSLSMNFGRPTKLLYAKRLAAALGYIGLVGMNRVVVEPFAGTLLPGTQMLRGRSQTFRLMEAISAAGVAEGAGNLPATCRAFSTRRRGNGVIVVISDFFDKAGYEAAFPYLIGMKMDVYALHVLAEEEVRPDLTGDLKLVDVEDGEAADVTISAPLLARYKQTLDDFCGGLRDYCVRRGMQYLFITNQTAFEQVVLTLLRKQGLLK